MDRVAAFFERKQPLIQLFILITLIATLVPISIQACVIRSEYEAKTRSHLAIEDVSIEQDIDKVYVVIGIINTGEIPAVNVKVDRMIMGGSWFSSGPIVYAPYYKEFPSDLIFLPNRCNRIPIPVERAIWDESFWEGKVIEIGLTYVWQGITNYYVANGKMRYDLNGNQSIDIYYDREWES